MTVFRQGDALKVFFRGQTRHIASWLAVNHQRLGLPGPVHPTRLSKALAGRDTSSDIVDALDQLLDEVSADPWAFCEPPSDLDDLTEYASCRWWYDALQPAVSWSRFERIGQFPLTGEDRELVQDAFDKWRARLKDTCARYQEDYDLVRSLHSDLNPKYQTWSKDPWRLDHHGTMRRRVGFPGLHGRTPEEIGRAFELEKHELPLPDVQMARLTYERPHAIHEGPYETEPVEPWNGQEFEGVEEDTVDGRRVRHRVIYYWGGQCYEIEDVEPFAQVQEGGQWRDTTQGERSLFRTGMVRQVLLREELLATKEQWIDEVWEERKASQSFQDRMQYPDGVPRSAIEEQFEIVLSRYEPGGHMAERALEEQREFQRREIEFMRTLRRRR